jgi:hypothetical protein
MNSLHESFAVGQLQEIPDYDWCTRTMHFLQVAIVAAVTAYGVNVVVRVIEQSRAGFSYLDDARTIVVVMHHARVGFWKLAYPDGFIR